MLLACKYIDYTGNTDYTKYNKQDTQSCRHLISFYIYENGKGNGDSIRLGKVLSFY